MAGTKKLCIPRTSTMFHWDAQQVLSVCSRDTLYILSDIEPLIMCNNKEIDVMDEEVTESSKTFCMFSEFYRER